MCFLVAKHVDRAGSVAIKTRRGKQLIELKRSLYNVVGCDKIQLVTVSRPSSYGEYAPYEFATTEAEFRKRVLSMVM